MRRRLGEIEEEIRLREDRKGERNGKVEER